MKRFLASALVAGALLLGIGVGISYAQGLATFIAEQQYVVFVNGESVSTHSTVAAAEADATTRKQANPQAVIGYVSVTMNVVTLTSEPPPMDFACEESGGVITWSDNGQSLYWVYRSDNGGQTFRWIGRTLGATTFTDSSAPAGALYQVHYQGIPRVECVDNDEPPSGGPLVFGYDETPPSSSWARPAFYESYIDPAYNTTVTRVSSAVGTRFNRNTYSRRQAENATGTRFMTYHGAAEYRVYNRSNGVLVRALDIHPDAEPQWHPTNPNRIRHIAGPSSSTGDLRLYELDVTTGASTVIADLTSRIRAVFPTAAYMKDRAEASPSMDGTRYAWLVYDANNALVGIVTYDLATNSLIGTLSPNNFPDSGFIDALDMSPTGRYVVVSHGTGTYVYNANLSNRRLIFAGGEHSDIALNAAGRDSYVYIDFTAGPEGGWLVSVDLQTLEHLLVFNLYDDANTSIHISGKGYNKPGWVVASTYNCKEPDSAWSCEKVMAVELAANGRVLNLAHTYNCGESYWTETHASVNRDFTRVYFNTDSGSCGIDAEVSIIDVPTFS